MSFLTDIFSSFDHGATDPEFFKPDLLDPIQTRLQELLGGRLENQLNFLNPNLIDRLQRGIMGNTGLQSDANHALHQQLSGKPDLSQSQNYFNKGLLEPALRGFDRNVAPQIKDYYAGQGATFSTARGNALTQARGDVFANAQSQLAQYTANAIEGAKNRQLQAIGIPMQQQLSRIQGIGSLSGIQNAAFNPILNLLGQQHRELVVGPGRGQAQYGSIGNAADTIFGGIFGGGFGGGLGK